MVPDDTTAPVNPTPADQNKGPSKGIGLCLSGGGYRAMVFHVGALWRLNEAGLLSKLSRISSVSGGSITAAVLGLNWLSLKFNGQGVAEAFIESVVNPVRKLASITIDHDAVVDGFLPGRINEHVVEAYREHLFHDTTLDDLPETHQGPMFVFNATNVQTGSLWRFSKSYMGDWQIGLIRNPKVPIAKVVSASSAFPPILSPCTLKVDSAAFDPATSGDLRSNPYDQTVVLSDGGVYDNLGLETVYKELTTVLVSDGGQKMSPDPTPNEKWIHHSIRVMDIIDNQVRSLRKRLLMNAYKKGDRTGAYWGIHSNFGDLKVDDPLKIAGASVLSLAQIPTRLSAMAEETQKLLINWGYAICDAALRKRCVESLKKDFDITISNPVGLPYADANL